ncbi:hypothetical protein ACWEFJ_07525 [Actinosynnema sp. NPDC004786]
MSVVTARAPAGRRFDRVGGVVRQRPAAAGRGRRGRRVVGERTATCGGRFDAGRA